MGTAISDTMHKLNIEQKEKIKADLESSNEIEKVSVIDENCMVKATITLIGGGGMGVVMGLFMSGVEFREIDTSRGIRQSTRQALKMDTKRIKNMARGFGVFGFFFALFECQVEKMRGTHDALNSFYAGAFTSMLLTTNAFGPRGLLLSGLGGGLLCMVFEKVMDH